MAASLLVERGLVAAEIEAVKGIAEVLVVAILETAREAGQDGVTLEYRISNKGARKLYEKWGFAEFHESWDLRGDLVCLRRPVL